MPSTYSANLRLELVASGEQGNTWGNTTNNNLGSLLEQAITGATQITSLPVTLTALNGASDQSRSMYLYVNAPTGGNIVAPATPKMYIITNSTTDSTNVVIKTASSTGVTIPGGASKIVYYNSAASDFVESVTAASAMYLSSAITSNTQATTKLYVDTANLNLLPRDGSRNMTGELILSSGAQPSNSLAAVSKQYVNSFDISVANTSGSTSAASGLIKAGSFSGGNLALTLAPATSTNLGGVKPDGTKGLATAADGALTVKVDGTTVQFDGSGQLKAIASGASGVASIAVTAPIVNTGTATNVALSMAANAYYPYTGNPSNFVTSSGSVSYATSAGSAPANGGNADTATTATLLNGSYAYGSGSPTYNSSGTQGLWFIGGTKSVTMFCSNATPNNGSAAILGRLNDGYVAQMLWSSTEVGKITVTSSATNYQTSSDYRLKENESPLVGALDRVAQLKPYRFNFKADPNNTVDGFFAHEVSSVVPQAIWGDKDGVDADGEPIYQGIDHSKLVPLLVAAIQELSAEVKALKGE